jgi:hypothetical protein
MDMLGIWKCHLHICSGVAPFSKAILSGNAAGQDTTYTETCHLPPLLTWSDVPGWRPLGLTAASNSGCALWNPRVHDVLWQVLGQGHRSGFADFEHRR